jgi:hypothetical protein
MTDPQAAETMAPVLGAITGNALTVVPRAELIFVPGGAEKVLASIIAKARAEAATLDVSRARDRDAMRSLAYKLRRLKTTGDESGKALKADYLAKINPIDAERRVWRDEMDVLVAEIVAPAEKFDADEAARLLAHETAIAELIAIGDAAPGLSSAELMALIEKLAHTHPVRQWQEFEDRAGKARRNAHNALVVESGVAVAREAAEAEAARLAEEEAERQRQETARLQAEREAEIARQAAEAARLAAEAVAAEEAARVAREAEEARLAAERAAQRADYHRRMLQHVKNCGFGFIDDQPQPIGILQHELTAKIKYDEENFGDLLPEAIVARDEALKALQRSIDESNRRQAEKEAAEAERLRIIRKAEEAERRAAAALAAERERAAQAERDRLATEERARQAAAQAKRDRIAAEERAEQQRLAAIEAERARVEGERIRQEAETRRREADKAHRAAINRAARDAIIKVIRSVAGSSSDQETTTAKAIVEAIARMEVPRVTISY